MKPEPFYSVLNTSVTLYDTNLIQGFYVFAGDVISDSNSTLKGSRSHMNATEWQRWDLGNQIASITSPYLGSVDVYVVDSATGAPLTNAAVSVSYNATTHVTRKVTMALPSGSECATSANCMSFGGWTGKAKSVPHTLSVSMPDYANTTMTVQVVPDKTTTVTVRMSKSKGVSNE